MAITDPGTNPHQCPFCGEEIPSPRKGFMIHINESEECDADLEMWRERVSDDMRGGWTG